eukprot:Gregarina_sp_Poly_1__3227@NODE_191_length_11641_cov_669_281061_g170_i0_p5_GENE_NODE_191_length_11641_cov_669_281061_g170_i0NODE_191_length_11641_cov_669_281061_g170_i0_p5_ORF_typecomplete_len275_score30_58_NODE_191_length_11641_cov_669_281061_g170_i022103034
MRWRTLVLPVAVLTEATAVSQVDCWSAVSGGPLSQLDCAKFCIEGCSGIFASNALASHCLSTVFAGGCFYRFLEQGTYFAQACLDSAQSVLAVTVPADMIRAVTNWSDSVAPVTLHITSPSVVVDTVFTAGAAPYRDATNPIACGLTPQDISGAIVKLTAVADVLNPVGVSVDLTDLFVEVPAPMLSRPDLVFVFGDLVGMAEPRKVELRGLKFVEGQYISSSGVVNANQLPTGGSFWRGGWGITLIVMLSVLGGAGLLVAFLIGRQRVLNAYR